MHKYVIIGVMALALAGCSKKGADADSDGKISDSEVAVEMAQGGPLVTKPGEWELRTIIEDVKITGMAPEQAKLAEQRSTAIPPIKTCISKAQADKPGADFFGATPGSNCTFEKLDRSGSKIEAAMTCEPSTGITIATKFEGTLGAESYSMKVEQKAVMPVGTAISKGRLDARRTGDCV